jgi:hypothetical protein
MGLKYRQRNVKQTNVEKHRSAQRETEQQTNPCHPVMKGVDLPSWYAHSLFLY